MNIWGKLEVLYFLKLFILEFLYPNLDVITSYARNLWSMLILQDNNIPELDKFNWKDLSMGIRSTSSTSIRYSWFSIVIFELPSSCHKKVSPPSDTNFLAPKKKKLIHWVWSRYICYSIIISTISELIQLLTTSITQ